MTQTVTQTVTHGSSPAEIDPKAPVAAIGFIGIGNMGWPMAANLVRAGYRVTVLDQDRDRAELFGAEFESARVAADVADCCGSAELVVAMLPDGRRVHEALVGERGQGQAQSQALFASLRPGTIVVDMSSSDPVATRELGAALQARGVVLIDAPVSGLVTRAESGTLTIMIGADSDEAVGRAMPVLERLGERLFRVGSLGCGHAMKALNNVVAATAFTATAEALIVGKRFGLDPAVMIDVLNVSSGRSFHSDISFPDHVLTRRFASGFTLGLLANDVGIAADLAGNVAAKTPLVALVNQLWADGRNHIGAAEDNSAIIRHWEKLNDVIIGTT